MLHKTYTFRPALPAGVLLAALAILLLQAPTAAQIRHKIRCDITQLVLEDCPNGIRADFDNGRHTWSFSVAGPIAFAEKMETYLVEPEKVNIVDYNTIGEANLRMIDVEKAWFLWDADGDESLSQAPHVYAFRTQEAAEEAQQELHGELKRWDFVFEEVTRIAEEWDRQAGHRYGSLRKGGRK